MASDSQLIDKLPAFELLARHLWPTFGNVYEYNLDGGDAGVDLQPWTDELREVVTDYLLHELPEDAAPYLFYEDVEALKDPTTKQTAVEELITGAQPWEVAFEVRQAAVKAVPTLDDLIGHLDDWPSGEERADAETWLDEHASRDMLEEMVRDLAGRNWVDWREMNVYDLVHKQGPRELLASWHQACGSASSDLTDDEWQMIVPFLPSGSTGLARTEEGRTRLRRELNGMLYRHYYDTSWPGVPQRYGTPKELHNRYANFRHVQHVFARMLAGLEKRPGAERVVKWLQQVT